MDFFKLKIFCYNIICILNVDYNVNKIMYLSF